MPFEDKASNALYKPLDQRVFPVLPTMTTEELLLLYVMLDDIGCGKWFVVLADVLYRPLSERRIVLDIQFCIGDVTDADAEFDFRFDVRGIRGLTSLFDLHEYVITPSRDKVHNTEAVCIVLHRFSYPKRHYDTTK